MSINAFVIPYILSLLHIPINPKPHPKRKNRISRNPPLSVLTHPNLPKPPTHHKFTRRLPKYLHNTTFLRNGAGIYTHPHKSGPPWKANHLFDGIAVAHSLTISTHSRPPTVTHTSAFVDNHFIQAISNTSHSAFAPVQIYHPPTFPRVINLFARDPTRAILYNLPVCIEDLPTMGTVARSDVSTLQPLHPRTLAPGPRLRFSDLHNRLRGQGSASHGITTADGYYYNYVLNLISCNVFSISPTGETRILANVMTQSKLIHSIVCTENYLIMPLCPYTIDLAQFVVNKSVMHCVRKLPRAASFAIIDRHNGGVVAEFCVDPFFMFHFINAYEEGDDIVVDTCAYQDTRILDQFRLERLAENGGVDSAVPTRFVFRDVERAKKVYPRMLRAEGRALSDACVEFPTVNPDFRGRKHRYVYGIGDRDGRMFLGELVKVDTETGDVKRWAEEGVYVGEPVFVGKEGGREDEGVLLCVASWGGEKGENEENGGSALLVVDAGSMKEISRAELGFSLSVGFHASAVTDSSSSVS